MNIQIFLNLRWWIGVSALCLYTLSSAEERWSTLNIGNLSRFEVLPVENGGGRVGWSAAPGPLIRRGAVVIQTMRVSRVIPGSPVELAGLRPGNIVIANSFDGGNYIYQYADYEALIKSFQIWPASTKMNIYFYKSERDLENLMVTEATAITPNWDRQTHGIARGGGETAEATWLPPSQASKVIPSGRLGNNFGQRAWQAEEETTKGSYRGTTSTFDASAVLGINQNDTTTGSSTQGEDSKSSRNSSVGSATNNDLAYYGVGALLVCAMMGCFSGSSSAQAPSDATLKQKQDEQFLIDFQASQRHLRQSTIDVERGMDGMK